MNYRAESAEGFGWCPFAAFQNKPGLLLGSVTDLQPDWVS